MDLLETGRLVLRRPRRADEPAIFSRRASDPEGTRYMAWPTHRSLEDTHAFLRLRDAWCRGYAAEALLASVEAARAGCPSDLPNLPPAADRDAAVYALTL